MSADLTLLQDIYTIYLDWDLVRTNVVGDQRFIAKPNRKAAHTGVRPELSDGSFVTLHHIEQNLKVPLVKTSTSLHDFKNQKALKILHQYLNHSLIFMHF